MKKNRKSEAKEKPAAAGLGDRIAAARLDQVQVDRLRAETPLGWYVVVAAVGMETKAEEALGELGFDVYRPCETRWKWFLTSKRQVRTPLFPGYLFVCSGRREAGVADDVWYAHGPDLDEAWTVTGVVGVLMSSGRPWPVQAGFVDALREAEAAGEFDLTRRPKKTYRPGDRVRITGGKFSGFIGEIGAAEDAAGRVQVLLAGLFKGGVPVSLDKVEAA